MPVKVIHIAGVVAGFIASIAAVGVGIWWAAEGGGPAGKMLSIGIAALASTVIATVDGARAMPQFGMWRIGARFEGIGDFATLLIIAIMAAGIAISFAF